MFAEDDYRRHSPRFQGENFAKNLALVEQIKQIAAEKQVTPSQLASAAAIDLTAEDLRRIESIAPQGVAVGDRYPDMSSVNR